jgi:hypothetical protein
MMKKLLVLLMVLGITSIASAAIQISVNGALDVEEITINVSDTITVDIHNTGGDLPINFNAYLDFYYLSEGLYSLSNPRLGPEAGNFPASFSLYESYYDNDEVWFVQAWVGAGDEIPGTIFLIDMHCEGTGDVLVELYDARVTTGYGLVDSLVIHQIPEPMTIGLLGLGALFLKRRK